MLCVAIVAVPVGGAHWHLCLDGSQSPATENFTVDRGEALAAAHSTESSLHVSTHDMDVELAGVTHAQKLLSTAPLTMMTAFAVVLLIAQRVLAPAISPPAYDPPLVSGSAFRLRPPLRAPPV